MRLNLKQILKFFDQKQNISKSKCLQSQYVCKGLLLALCLQIICSVTDNILSLSVETVKERCLQIFRLILLCQMMSDRLRQRCPATEQLSVTIIVIFRATISTLSFLANVLIKHFFVCCILQTGITIQAKQPQCLEFPHLCYKPSKLCG